MADDNKPTALVPFEGFKNELVARQDEIAALLPSTITREAFVNTAIVAVKNNPALLECDRRSLHKAVTAAAHDGMKPDGREGVIIPQNEKIEVNGKDVWTKTARWQPMAHGIRKRARELDGIIVDTAVVHENDHFRHIHGDDARIEHEPAPLGTDRGKPVGAYAIFRKGAEILHREVMDEKDIAAVRASTEAAEWPDVEQVHRRGVAQDRVEARHQVGARRRCPAHRAGARRRHVRPHRSCPRHHAGGAAAAAGQGAGHPGDVAGGRSAGVRGRVREFKERALTFIRAQEPAEVLDWAKRNTIGLREFWGIEKDAALAIKAEIEKAAARQEPKAAPLVEEPPPPVDRDDAARRPCRSPRTRPSRTT